MARRALALLSLALAGCGGDDGNFSQFPGFEAYFAANPPVETAPTAAEEALLRRHQPRFFLPPEHEGPISFYDDYIASGTLTDGGGDTVAERVTPALLNAYKHDPDATFVHKPRPPVGPPVVFARIDRDEVEVSGETHAFTFLTYHLVFRSSGLSHGLPAWQRTLADVVADADDWHQLDHYTAVTLALVGEVPVAMTLQQHNYMRTYVFGEDVGLPTDGRVAIDVARGSNELYPHDPAPQRHRAAAFMTPETLPYLVNGGEAPTMAAEDLTHGVAEVDYRLQPLAPADAFYTFKGWLGERRWLPGRDGPPGADYNTLPTLKPRARQLVAFYWRDGDAEYVELATRLTANWREGADDATLERLGERFVTAWRCQEKPVQVAACGQAGTITQ